MQLEIEFIGFLSPARQRRARRRARAAAERADQLSIDFPKRLPPGIPRKNRRRWAKYDFSLVEEARRLRFTKKWIYRDIAEFLNTKYGTSISWITIRDWTSQFYRVTG